MILGWFVFGYKKDIKKGLTISVRDPISVVFNFISFSIGRALGRKRIQVGFPTQRIVTLERPPNQGFCHSLNSDIIRQCPAQSMSGTESVNAHKLQHTPDFFFPLDSIHIPPEIWMIWNSFQIPYINGDTGRDERKHPAYFFSLLPMISRLSTNWISRKKEKK